MKCFMPLGVVFRIFPDPEPTFHLVSDPDPYPDPVSDPT
jgi:hypothetical protein